MIKMMIIIIMIMKKAFFGERPPAMFLDKINIFLRIVFLGRFQALFVNDLKISGYEIEAFFSLSKDEIWEVQLEKDSWKLEITKN